MLQQEYASLDQVLGRARVRLMHSVRRHEDAQLEKLVLPGEVLQGKQGACVMCGCGARFIMCKEGCEGRKRFTHSGCRERASISASRAFEAGLLRVPPRYRSILAFALIQQRS